MNNEKIIITGAGGFIGSELVHFFSKKNYLVIALVHNLPVQSAENVMYVKYDLSGTLDETIFTGAKFFIHCAYIPDDVATNIEGTKKLLNASRKFDIKKNVFISSFSARADTGSKYGKQKFEIEKLFHTEKDCVLRAGVVLGNGGLFKKMSEHIKSGKPIPLPGGGNQPLQTIHIYDLIAIIEKVFSENFHGIFSVAEPVPVLYKDFFRAVAESCNRKPKFISIPFFILNPAMAVAEFLGIKLPVNRDNVEGLKKMRAMDTKQDLMKLGVSVRTYREALILGNISF